MDLFGRDGNGRCRRCGGAYGACWSVPGVMWFGESGEVAVDKMSIPFESSYLPQQFRLFCLKSKKKENFNQNFVQKLYKNVKIQENFGKIDFSRKWWTKSSFLENGGKKIGVLLKMDQQ